MRGTVSRGTATLFSKNGRRRRNRNLVDPDTACEPTVGDMSCKHYVSLHVFRRDASGTDFCDVRLEIESSSGGKSNVAVTYIQPSSGCGERYMAYTSDGSGSPTR